MQQTPRQTIKTVCPNSGVPLTALSSMLVLCVSVLQQFFPLTAACCLSLIVDSGLPLFCLTAACRCLSLTAACRFSYRCESMTDSGLPLISASASPLISDSCLPLIFDSGLPLISGSQSVTAARRFSQLCIYDMCVFRTISAAKRPIRFIREKRAL